MSFLGSIANLGLASQGYDNMDARISQRNRRDVDEMLTKRAVDEALRKDELAVGARDAMAKIPTRAAAMGLDVDTMVPPDESDRWGETKVETTKGIDSPASPDLRGKLKAASDYLADKGEVEAAQKYQKQLKDLEAEGYKKMIVDMADGKDPREIATEFNKTGQRRIVNGRLVNGKVYEFQYEDGASGTYDRDQVRAGAVEHGFLKKRDLQTVAHDSTVIDAATGDVVARGPETPRLPRNIDPLSPEGIEAAKKRAAAIAGTKPSGADPTARRPGNLNQFDSQVKSLATQHLTTVDDSTGKPTVDRANLVKLTALASSIGRKDSTLSPAEALQAAIVEFDADREQQDSATEQATQEGAKLGFESEKQRAAWVKSRAAGIARARGGKGSGAKAPAAAPATAKAGPSGVSAPETQEDFDALPTGTRFVNPKDGRIYVKK